jgi:hypothetical protein
VRVQPGGLVAMANWTPEGFIRRNISRDRPAGDSAPGVPPPILWGDEKLVKQRFSSGIAELKTEKYTVNFKYQFPPEKWSRSSANISVRQ